MSLVHKFVQNGEFYILDVNTGAVHIVDELVYDLIDEESLKTKEELIENFKDKHSVEAIEEVYDEISELIKEGFLYTEDNYEEVALKSQNSKDYIKAVCLNITHDCNLRCKYCFADEGKYHGARKVMSPVTGKKAIDFVIAHSGPRRNIEIDLFGGEPLIAMKEIKEIIAYAREQEKLHNKVVRFTMTTNGTLLNEEIMDYMDKEMGNIVLSIDGRKDVNDNMRTKVDGSGTYDTILPKIIEMVEKRDKSKSYYVRGTFTRDNLDFYNDVKHLADLGFKEISVEPVVLADKDPLSLRKEDLPTIFENYDKLYDEMYERYKNNNEFKFYHFNVDLQGGPCVYKRISGCGAGHEYIAITPEGDIYPCHQFVGNNDFKMGTIYDEDEKIDWKISKTFKEAHIYNKPVCRECWAKFYCSGGCQANNYNFNGSLNIPYEVGCEMQKKRIECAIALKAKKMEDEL